MAGRSLGARGMAVVGLLLAACAVLAVYAWVDLIPAAQRADPAPVMLHADDGEFNGNTFEVRRAVWGEFNAPPDTRSLTVTVTVHPGDDPGTCGPLTLVDETTSEEFADARLALGADWDAGESFCLTDDSAPYRLFAVFLIPDDRTGPFMLMIPGEPGETASIPISF